MGTVAHRVKTDITSFGGLPRSVLMSRIRSSGNATTELRLIALLRKSGLKGWRRNYPLFGKPDFVFPNERVTIFVDGCFWHGHQCGRNLTPMSNASAWQEKISRNQRRDRRVTRELRFRGWSVLRIWECRLTKSPLGSASRIQRALANATTNLRSDKGPGSN